jgi:hypothetical protein
MSKYKPKSKQEEATVVRTILIWSVRIGLFLLIASLIIGFFREHMSGFKDLGAPPAEKKS